MSLELARLLKENELLRQERDLLEKRQLISKDDGRQRALKQRRSSPEAHLVCICVIRSRRHLHFH
jgi:hypothetical protein